ncbi:MAG: hypothetical protein PHE09_19410 [Oscillospiraceae bacterium]|nr:hypothetical protein [Oscillospiraceae bacterium]
MIKTSDAYQTMINSDGRRQYVNATVTLSNSYVYSLTNADIMLEGTSITDNTSESGKFTVGTFAAKCLKLKLYNFDGRFSEKEFARSTIRIKTGLQIGSSIEWLYKGTYFTSSHSESGGIITLTAYDAAVNFDKKYDSKLSYPASLHDILQDACKCCYVVFGTASFPNSGYVVAKRPTDTSITYADIVKYVAELAGCWARISVSGKLILSWYDADTFALPESGNTIDGGAFSDYQQASLLDGGTFYPMDAHVLDGGNLLDSDYENETDGGNFSDYSQTALLPGGDFYDYGKMEEDILSGGIFRTDVPKPVSIHSLSSCTVYTDDLRVTGAKLITDNGTVERGGGSFIVTFQKNPLAQGNPEGLIDGLALHLIDFTFRPMKVSGWDNPSIEAGDTAVLTDYKGNMYHTIVSGISYTIGKHEEYSADAESREDNGATAYSDSDKSISKFDANTDEALAKANGRIDHSIHKTIPMYYQSTSPEILSEGLWQDTCPDWKEGTYIWTKNITYYNDGTTTETDAACINGNTGEKGEDAVTVTITSSNGFIFKGSSISTILTAHVFKGGQELTADEITKLGILKWYQDGSDTAIASGKTLAISAGDVLIKATYLVQLEDDT